MKKRGLLLLIAMITALSATGCSDEDTATQDAGEQISIMKEEDVRPFTSFLEEGIAESNDSYVLQFPGELQKPYLTFLQKAFGKITFEMSSAGDDGEDISSVLVSFTPLDIAATTKDTTEEYLDSMSSPDLAEETAALLGECEDALEESPVYKEETHLTLEAQKSDESYTLKEDAVTELLSMSLTGYMEPYNSVCEILDERDALQSYLDAQLKGEFGQFTRHTGKTEEEAAAWYDSGTFDAPEGMDSSYADRYRAALQELLKKCQYTIGIPKKADDPYSYTVDVTVVPNVSLINLSSDLSNSTFATEEEVDQTFIALLEKYAAEPAYGEETTVNVSFGLDFFSESNEDITKLTQTILPSE